MSATRRITTMLWLSLVLASSLLLTTATVSARRGLIVTAPHSWIVGKPEQVCVSFHGIDFDVLTSTTLKTEPASAEGSPRTTTGTPNRVVKSVNFNQGTDGCFPMTLEPGVSSPVQLRFTAVSMDKSYNYSFTDTRPVLSRTEPQATSFNLSFIDLDKPVYKPGDQVKFRTVTLQEELKTRLEQIPLVYVNNPSGIRMIQWKNVDVQATQGIGEFQFTLSSDPVYGIWTVHLQQPDGKTATQNFEVKEYVLPKYEVLLKQPSYVPVYAETVEAEVCAKYTFGEPVKGNVTVDMCLKPTYPMFNSEQPNQCQAFSAEIKGCQKFDIPVQGLLGSAHRNHYDYYGLKITLNATMEEEGTGVLQNKSQDTAPLGFDVMNIKFEDMSSYYKPGLPYQGKILVTFPNGSVAANQAVQVYCEKTTTQKYPSEQITTDSNGIAQWTWTDLSLPEEESHITIRAEIELDMNIMGKFKNYLHEPRSTFSLREWYSPSNSFMAIDQISETVECGDKLTAHVSYTNGHNHEFHYKVTTQYTIVLEGEAMHSPSTDGLSLELSLPSGLWGDSNLLVYYVRSDGEIVADSRNFKMAFCFLNKVEMSFGTDEAAPGADLMMELSASPGSMCAYSAIDKSVLLMGANNLVTFDDAAVSQYLERMPVKEKERYMYTMTPWETDEYCRAEIKKEKEEEEARKALKKSKKRERGRNKGRKNRRPRSFPPVRPYPEMDAYSRYVDASEAFKSPDLVVISDLTLMTRPCLQREWEMPYIRYSAGPRYRSPKMRMHKADFGQPGPIPARAAEMPVPESVTVDESSPEAVVDTVRSFFPETWLWGLTLVSSSGESHVPEKAPDTITEWYGRAFCTHPDYGVGLSNQATLKTFQPFFVSFSMPYSVVRGETVQLPVSVFNYLTECLVIEMQLLESDHYELAAGSATTQVCVCGQEKQTHAFPITATSLGTVNVTVRATSVHDNSVCGNVILSSQVGVQDTVIREMLIEPEGKEQEYTHSDFVCPSGGSGLTDVELTLPANLVQDSASAKISVIGDIMGPALSGLDQLIRLPTGCGEQTMLSFAPNIYILQYLTHTHQLTPEIEKMTLEYLRSGYQRELTYRHLDGSYSAFGTNDISGSTWLSAFVLKSFSQAADFIEIDENDLMQTRRWFQNNQLENGCYRHVGRIIHKSMKGGLSSNTENSPALTAYVLGALLETGYNPESFMLSGAVDCLQKQDISDAYTVALSAYALTLWHRDHQVTHDFMDKLDALKVTEGGLVHWPGSAQVETTAYAMMAMLQSAENPMEQIVNVLPIARWLSAQRNSGGGFHSTQDTVVGLQALAKFAQYIFNDQSHLTVQVSQTASNVGFQFEVDSSNSLVLQQEEVSVPNNITFEYSGSGCAFIQATTKYNILDMSSGSKPSIYVNVEPSRTEDNNCRRRNMKICYRYEGPDDRTNMAMVDIKMVTGWIPLEDSVERLKQETALNIKRIELEKKNVYIYLNELIKDQLSCLEFQVEEDIVVRDARPGSVSVFDYYDQENVFAQRPYTLRSICGTKAEIPLNNVVGPNDNNDVVEQRRIAPPEFPFKNVDARNEEEMSCPLCHPQTVTKEELKDTLCSASHVYMGYVKRPGKLKFTKDLVKDETEAKMRKNVDVAMDEECVCDVLSDRKQHIWIITEGSTLEDVGKNKAAILLTDKDQVVAIDKKPKDLVKFLKKTRKSKKCRSRQRN